MEEETLYSNAELEEVFGQEVRRYYPPKHIEHGALRISAIFEELRTAIKSRDPVAVEVGCRIILADPRLPFGKLIKSGVARALRQNYDMVNHENRQAIASKTLQLLGLPFAPRELEDYCKLVKKFKSSEWRPLLGPVEVKNEKAQHLLSYLQAP